MSKGTSKTKHPFNKTVIKNGRIVVIRKDGRIKADLGPYAPQVKRAPSAS